MRIAIRVDSSESIGTGHVYRCSGLAKSLTNHGHECIFYCKSHPGNISGLLISAGYQVKFLSLEENDENISDKNGVAHQAWLGGSQEHDVRMFLDAIGNETKPNLVIVDHYALSDKWERLVFEQLGCLLVVVDDLCDRKHYCNFLIDQTFMRNSRDYDGLINESALAITGTSYALIRDEFRFLRPAAITRRIENLSPKKLLITMGGIDEFNYSKKILTFLDENAYITIFSITLVVGVKCPHIKELKAYSAELGVNFIVNASDMANLMLQNDIAIGALGGTTWERCVLGLPALNVVVAENQKNIADQLEIAGHITIDARTMTSQEFKSKLNTVIDNAYALSKSSFAICNGRGLSIVTDIITPNFNKKSEAVLLRKASQKDVFFIYELQKIPEIRKFSNNPQVPLWEDHCKWMKAKLSEKSTWFYIIVVANKDIGSIRLDKKNHPKTGDCYEISLFTHPDAQGMGNAKIAVRQLKLLHQDKKLLATVLPGNLSSHSLFESMGFKKIAETLYLFEGEHE